MVSQRPDHPLTNRRKTRGKSEPFSKSFWKFLEAAWFVSPSLLYGQNRSDRKNMALMQFRVWTVREIAKMQDRIKLQNMQFYFGHNVAVQFTSNKFERQIVVRSCVAYLTPSHSTVIHHKRASRYVVLGEVSDSPFTEYIFIDSASRVQVLFPGGYVLRDRAGGLFSQLRYLL